MAQQDLVQKTRFEKQIPFPILSAIAAEIKKSEDKHPDHMIDLDVQTQQIQDLVESIDLTETSDFSEHNTQIAIKIIAEGIRAIKYIQKQ